MPVSGSHCERQAWWPCAKSVSPRRMHAGVHTCGGSHCKNAPSFAPFVQVKGRCILADLFGTHRLTHPVWTRPQLARRVTGRPLLTTHCTYSQVREHNTEYSIHNQPLHVITDRHEKRCIVINMMNFCSVYARINIFFLQCTASRKSFKHHWTLRFWVTKAVGGGFRGRGGNP